MATVLMAAYTNYSRDPRVRREAEALVEEGHRVVFIARGQPGQPRRETIMGVDVRRTRARSHKPDSVAAYLADYLLFFLQICAHMTAHPLRYRLIHVSNMPDFLVLAAWLPRALGVPVIHDVHDPMPELYMEKFHVGARHWVIRLLASQEWMAGRFATQVLTVEERLKDVLSQRGIPRNKISVLFNLPDERIFAPPREPRTRRPGAPFVLAYHGTLAHRLGLDIAVEAMPVLCERIPDIELRIIGDGEAREELARRAADLGVASRVAFSDGFVPVEEIPYRLADVDVGVIPMRISSATELMLPTKLLEYVQMGIPCVVPRTQTIMRYFDAAMVQFFDADDPTSFAGAVEDLYAHPDKRLELGQAAWMGFGAKYRWNEHKRVYTNLVERLLAA